MLLQFAAVLHSGACCIPLQSLVSFPDPKLLCAHQHDFQLVNHSVIYSRLADLNRFVAKLCIV